MSVNSAMTAIADKIRALRGTTSRMGLDAMSTNLATVQTNLNSAYTAIGNKGGTVPSSKVSGNLVSAINSIPTGGELPELSDPGTADDLISGKELIGQNGEKITGNVQMVPSGNTGLIAPASDVSFVKNNYSDYINMRFLFPDRIAFDAQSALNVQSNAVNFGDATEADVTAGKTFTSASGLRKVGTKANTGGGSSGPYSYAEEFIWTAPAELKNGDTVSITHSLGVEPDGFNIVALETELSDTAYITNNIVCDRSMSYAGIYPFVIYIGFGAGLGQWASGLTLFTDVSENLTRDSINYAFSNMIGTQIIPAGKQYRVLVYKR